MNAVCTIQQTYEAAWMKHKDAWVEIYHGIDVIFSTAMISKNENNKDIFKFNKLVEISELLQEYNEEKNEITDPVQIVKRIACLRSFSLTALFSSDYPQEQDFFDDIVTLCVAQAELREIITVAKESGYSLNEFRF